MDGYRLATGRMHRLAQTAALLIAIAGLTALSGWLLFGAFGAVLAGVLAVTALVVGRTLPVGTALRMRGAAEARALGAPELEAMVASLARRAGIAKAPRVFVLPLAAPQALTVGNRQSSAVAVTPALLGLLRPWELEAVLAHEIAHLRNGDTSLLTLADSMRRFTRTAALVGVLTAALSAWGALFGGPVVSLSIPVVLLVVPSLVALALMALSRIREFDADLGAVALTGDPRPLASALARIEAAVEHPLRRFFPGGAPEVPDFLRSHPRTNERIRRLLELRPPRATLVAE